MERGTEHADNHAHTTAARYNPVTVANRIEKIAADIRRTERSVVADVYDSEKGYRPATEEHKAKRAAHYAAEQITKN